MDGISISQYEEITSFQEKFSITDVWNFVNLLKPQQLSSHGAVVHSRQKYDLNGSLILKKTLKSISTKNFVSLPQIIDKFTAHLTIVAKLVSTYGVSELLFYPMTECS